MAIAIHAPKTPTNTPPKFRPLSVGVAGAIKPNKAVPIIPPIIPTATLATQPIWASVFIIFDANQPTNPAKINVTSKFIYNHLPLIK